MNTPLATRIAARRRAQEPGAPASTVASVHSPIATPGPSRAPFVPEWRRRAEAAVRERGYVAVVDTTEAA